MFFVLSFFNATFLNSYTASTVGDREKIWHRDGTVSFTVPVKNVSIWPTPFLNLILYITVFYLTAPDITT